MGEENNKILVHTCCAACFSYVYKVLSDEGFSVIAYFYNPEVHGRSEYNKRLEDVKTFCEENDIKLIAPAYDIQQFFAPIMPYQDKNSIKFINDKKRWRLKRCQICYSLQMTATVNEAKKQKCAHFTSTLLTSPYKDHDEVMNIGLELEQETKLKFYYKDFRKGYWNGRNFARNHKMHIPGYCGCVYSSEEGMLE